MYPSRYDRGAVSKPASVPEAALAGEVRLAHHRECGFSIDKRLLEHQHPVQHRIGNRQVPGGGVGGEIEPARRGVFMVCAEAL